MGVTYDLTRKMHASCHLEHRTGSTIMPFAMDNNVKIRSMTKDDPEFVTTFVQCVQKFDCLYNYTLCSYSNRDEQEKAWNEVAREMKATVDECKTKWKNLRGCLTRYLKKRSPGSSGGKAVKPYYLFQVMQFLVPFTKSRTKSSNVDEYEEWEAPKVEDPQVAAVASEDPTGDGDTLEAPLPDLHRGKEGPRLKFRKRMRKATNSLEESALHSLPPRNSSFNQDLYFFKSILPDIAQFSQHHKRLFKQRVLQLIDEFATIETPPNGITPVPLSIASHSYTFSESSADSVLPSSSEH